MITRTRKQYMGVSWLTLVSSDPLFKIRLFHSFTFRFAFSTSGMEGIALLNDLEKLPESMHLRIARAKCLYKGYAGTPLVPSPSCQTNKSRFNQKQR